MEGALNNGSGGGCSVASQLCPFPRYHDDSDCLKQVKVGDKVDTRTHTHRCNSTVFQLNKMCNKVKLFVVLRVIVVCAPRDGGIVSLSHFTVWRDSFLLILLPSLILRRLLSRFCVTQTCLSSVWEGGLVSSRLSPGAEAGRRWSGSRRSGPAPGTEPSARGWPGS